MMILWYLGGADLKGRENNREGNNIKGNRDLPFSYSPFALNDVV